MSSAEEEDGLLSSLQFVDVVVLRAVAMMSVLPVRFEILFQNCLGLVVGGRAVRFCGSWLPAFTSMSAISLPLVPT